MAVKKVNAGHEEQEIKSKLEELIQKYRGQPGGLIPLLQEAQDLKGYLPREMLEQIASGMHISLAKVYGVVSFYSQFYIQPRGRHIIRVCAGTACHVRGGEKIFEAIKKELQIDEGEVTRDNKFFLERVSCVGSCSLAPVVMIDDNTHGRLTADQISCLLKEYE